MRNSSGGPQENRILPSLQSPRRPSFGDAVKVRVKDSEASDSTDEIVAFCAATCSWETVAEASLFHFAPQNGEETFSVSLGNRSPIDGDKKRLAVPAG
jgi:hypothetical protein